MASGRLPPLTTKTQAAGLERRLTETASERALREGPPGLGPSSELRPSAEAIGAAWTPRQGREAPRPLAAPVAAPAAVAAPAPAPPPFLSSAQVAKSLNMDILNAGSATSAVNRVIGEASAAGRLNEVTARDFDRLANGTGASAQGLFAVFREALVGSSADTGGARPSRIRDPAAVRPPDSEIASHFRGVKVGDVYVGGITAGQIGYSATYGVAEVTNAGVRLLGLESGQMVPARNLEFLWTELSERGGGPPLLLTEPSQREYDRAREMLKTKLAAEQP
jgi:hypothetical protein